MKEDDALKFLILEFILDHIFGPEKNKFLFALYFFSAEACPISSVILSCICRVKAETFYEYIGTIPFQCTVP